jgi:hypothetical protein
MTVRILLLSWVAAAGLAQAGELRVIVSGEVVPGVYGRVEYGNLPPPPVLYSEPMVIVRRPQQLVVQPIYVHVPPGHAKNWKRHCGKYDLCSQPVYFVKSKEYDADYGKKPKKPKQEKKEKD